MWSTKSQSSDAILLLEPKASKPSKLSKVDPTASYIGGTPSFFPDDATPHPLCVICKEEMFLVIQMYAPLDKLERNILVFGCNSASCVNQMFQQGSNAIIGDNFKFCLGGNGVFKCIRSQRGKELEERIEAAVVETEQMKMVSTWDVDDGGGWGDDDASDENDWGTGEETDKGDCNAPSSMDDLHAMLAAMEMKDQDKNSPQNKANKRDPPIHTVKHKKGDGDSSVAKHSFPKYDLDVYDEPYISVQDGDSDDEDIQDTTSDKDIQNLLSKYLKEEDDSDIVSAIKGGASSLAGGAGAGNGEKYERLPPEERAFLTFTSRIKRAPKQVARYAYGGVPLWSIPTPLTPKGKRGGQSRDLKFPVIPPCPCGAHREFECQVMPSILHTIGVDEFITRKEKSKGSNVGTIEIDEILSKNNGGMNWGTIAVYSCAVSCSNREEFIIVQESADGDPKKREMM